MNPELKEKWLKALRSNNYKQGTGCLRHKAQETFCCLGVLCDISGEGDWELDNDDDDGATFRHFDGSAGYGALPDGLRERVNLSHCDMDMLIRMNDTQDKSFEEIANFVEAVM